MPDPISSWISTGCIASRTVLMGGLEPAEGKPYRPGTEPGTGRVCKAPTTHTPD